MSCAIADALTRCPRVLVIGTDCPLLNSAYIAAAAKVLDDHEAVLGPAEDGGYVLVGATRPLPLSGVRWSTPHTLADTTAGFARAGIRAATTSPLWDVDEPADVARWESVRLTAMPSSA